MGVVRLNGPYPVPDWFKELSDGCSAPLPERFRAIYEYNSRVPCYIHDYEYYECRKMWTRYVVAKRLGRETKKQLRHRKKLWKSARKTADKNFRRNIWAQWRRNGHPVILGVGYSWAVTYWATVRIAGRDAAKKNAVDSALNEARKKAENVDSN